MTSLGTADVADVLETLYLKDNVIPDMIARDIPTLMMLNHSTEGGGDIRKVHVRYTKPQARATTYALALQNAKPSKREAFEIDYFPNIQSVTIDGEVIRRAKGNKTIMIDHIEAEMSGAIDEMRNDISIALFGNGGGARGQEDGSWVSGNVISLTRPTDAYNFELGQVLKVSAADGLSGAERAGSTFVTATDPEAGTITVDDITDITGFAQDDYIFVEGDFGAKAVGLAGWIPQTTPTATPFLGVNRSVSPERLGGCRQAALTTITETLTKLMARIRGTRTNANVDAIIMHPDTAADLYIEMEDRKRSMEVKGKGAFATISFEAVVFAGNVPIIEDMSCPEGIAYALSTDTWTYETVGEMVQVVNEDGSTVLRSATADAFEARMWNCGNFYCVNPGANGVAVLP